MATLVTVIHVFVCLFLVLTVLLQPGKGGGMGGAFGGGSTQSVFGGSGGSSILRKATVFVAAIFMLSSMTLAWLGSNTGADALKEFSVSERQRHERKESLRRAVLEGAEETDSGDDVEGLGDEGLGEDAPIAPGEELTPEEIEKLLEEAAGEGDVGGEAEIPADEPEGRSDEPDRAGDDTATGGADDSGDADEAATDEGEEAATDEGSAP